jgi:hypothetical protein
MEKKLQMELDLLQEKWGRIVVGFYPEDLRVIEGIVRSHVNKCKTQMEAYEMSVSQGKTDGNHPGLLNMLKKNHHNMCDVLCILSEALDNHDSISGTY